MHQYYPHLAAEFGVSRIGLFGSFAKGLANENSDVDLFVELNTPPGFKFIELGEYLEKLLGRKVDILTQIGLQDIRVDRIAHNITIHQTLLFHP